MRFSFKYLILWVLMFVLISALFSLAAGWVGFIPAILLLVGGIVVWRYWRTIRMYIYKVTPKKETPTDEQINNRVGMLMDDD